MIIDSKRLLEGLEMPLRRLTKFLTVVPEANMKLIKTLRIMKSIKKTQGKGSIDSLMKSTWYSLHDKSRQVIFGVQMIKRYQINVLHIQLRPVIKNKFTV